MYGPKRNIETNEYERRTNNDLNNRLLKQSQPDLVAIMKSKTIG